MKLRSRPYTKLSVTKCGCSFHSFDDSNECFVDANTNSDDDVDGNSSETGDDGANLFAEG